MKHLSASHTTNELDIQNIGKHNTLSKNLLILIKYLPSLFFIAMIFLHVGGRRVLLFQLLELLSTAAISNVLINKNKIVGQLVNGLLLLLLNIQLAVEDLGGHAALYIASVIVVLLFSFIPIHSFIPQRITQSALIGFLLIELVCTMAVGNSYSPLYAYANLVQEKIKHDELHAQANSMENLTPMFYDQWISNGITKPDNLPENPNVILIFTEGLSQNVIDDGRSIMPNIASYQSRSLSFSNYWNHSFATYKGLIGQLYSGYQLNNSDSNTLISFQSILADRGYSTTFINTEPNNTMFYNYLASFDFQTLISEPGTQYHGGANSLSDKEAYELLFEIAEQKNSTEQPFLITMYTLGTHVTFDSPDEIFEDGSSRVLNRFYNVDFQFGEFMRKFEESDLAKDTIIVFTTDHATYVDNDYLSTFEPREHPSLDTIPFFIYYRDVVPQTIDVMGRNSLDLSPTLLDYLDISNENYFLGTSLFVSDDSSFDTIYTEDGARLFSTEGGSITELEGTEFSTMQGLITSYFAAKTQEPVDLG